MREPTSVNGWRWCHGHERCREAHGRFAVGLGDLAEPLGGETVLPPSRNKPLLEKARCKRDVTAADRTLDQQLLENVALGVAAADALKQWTRGEHEPRRLAEASGTESPNGGCHRRADAAGQLSIMPAGRIL